MIFTIGYTESYRKALDRHDGKVFKFGCDPDSNYLGGIVFETYEEALRYIREFDLQGRYSIFKLDADWEEDTYVADDYLAYLTRDALIIEEVL